MVYGALLAGWLLVGAPPSPACSAAAPVTPGRALRVCADPNNLPFSNQRLEGLENRLAELIARELNATVRYTWWAQRRGFFRNTLNAGLCDVVMGVPSNFALVLTTRPYYRSTYVFLMRQDRGYHIPSLDAPLLRDLKIGVHLIGDDYATPPPAHALAKRQIIHNVVGYSIYGDYREENPPARIIDAVVSGEIDVAIVWGPLAGYFARRQPVALTLVPVPPSPDLPSLPFVFAIAMGVRKHDVALKTELEAVLQQQQTAVQALLEEYGIPLVRPDADAKRP
jgi:quinoprotein dehydrogenase-associated probable ABC transporter substrate-binding protein